MARVLVGVHGTSPSRSPSSTLPPSLHEYPGCMPDKPPSTLESRVVVRLALKPLRVVLERPRVLLGEVFNST
jgi:hypothetical protein